MSEENDNLNIQNHLVLDQEVELLSKDFLEPETLYKQEGKDAILSEDLHLPADMENDENNKDQISPNNQAEKQVKKYNTENTTNNEKEEEEEKRFITKMVEKKAKMEKEKRTNVLKNIINIRKVNREMANTMTVCLTYYLNIIRSIEKLLLKKIISLQN